MTDEAEPVSTSVASGSQPPSSPEQEEKGDSMLSRPLIAGRLVSILFIIGMAARSPIAEAQAPSAQPSPPSVNPSPTSPPTVAPDLVLDRLRQMEEKLNALSDQNARLSQENQSLAEQYNELSRKVQGTARGSNTPGTGSTSGEGMFGGTGGEDAIIGGNKSGSCAETSGEACQSRPCQPYFRPNDWPLLVSTHYSANVSVRHP
jgi:hypothetical protein